jgi:hypothetical protein
MKIHTDTSKAHLSVWPTTNKKKETQETRLNIKGIYSHKIILILNKSQCKISEYYDVMNQPRKEKLTLMR